MAKLTPEEKAKIKEDAKIKLAEAKREAARKKLKNPVLYNVPRQTGNPEKDAKADLDEVQKSFRERIKTENNRFKNTTDNEYWFAMCFQTREQKEAFLKAMNLFLICDKYLDGVEVAKQLGINIPEANVNYLPDGKVDKDFAKFVA